MSKPPKIGTVKETEPEVPDFEFTPGRKFTLAGAPEGHDARLLVELIAQEKRDLLHFASDDGRMARLTDLVAFYDPSLEIINFPAWDCLPYDRVSPNTEIVGQRIAALAKLMTPAKKPRLIIATVNAVAQRVPPHAMVKTAAFNIAVGDRVDIEVMQLFFAGNG